MTSLVACEPDKLTVLKCVVVVRSESDVAAVLDGLERRSRRGLLVRAAATTYQEILDRLTRIGNAEVLVLVGALEDWNTIRILSSLRLFTASRDVDVIAHCDVPRELLSTHVTDLKSLALVADPDVDHVVERAELSLSRA